MKPSRFLWLAALCFSGLLSVSLAAQTDAGPRINSLSASAQVTVTARVTDAAQVAFALPSSVSNNSNNLAHHAAPFTANSFALDLATARQPNNLNRTTSTGLRIETRRGGWWYSLPVTLTVRSLGTAETAAPFAVSLTTADDAPDAPETFTLPAGETTITPRIGFFVRDTADSKPIKLRLIYRALLP